MAKQPLFIAMFLPQFHRDPHNDRWWGEGFTEWENVQGARPLFDGHQQPRLPVGGPYDLANAEEIARQWETANSAGIDGFAIYDYWYEGERLLNRPLDIIKASQSLPIRYSLAWANHPWTRSWTNRAGALDVLIAQGYGRTPASRESHFSHLFEHFADSRYLRRDGRPIFQVYNPVDLIKQNGYIDQLREFCWRNGAFELEVSAMLTGWRPNWDFLAEYDSATLFQPSMALFSPVEFNEPGRQTNNHRVRALPINVQKLIYRAIDILPKQPKLFDYSVMCEATAAQAEFASARLPVPCHPMVNVAFDNTPRYGKRARILEGQTVQLFQKCLESVAQTASNSGGNLVFINSWNEWGEGAHLQPDVLDGNSRLVAISSAKKLAIP
jgi:Glycosyltransferase WbsX